MVKIMENLINMDDLGVFPIIFGNTHMDIYKLNFFWGDVETKNSLNSEPGHVKKNASKRSPCVLWDDARPGPT